MLIEILLMILGQIAASTSIFLIRSSQLAPGYIASYRLFLTVILALPLFLADVKKLGQSNAAVLKIRGLSLHVVKHCLFPGVMLGIHFIFWNMAAPRTLAANASLIVNMVPIFMPIIVFIMTSERPIKQEVIATVVAVSGVLLLTFGDLSFNGGQLLGDLYAFISMLFLAVYLALSKKNKTLPFWYYISAVYFFGGVTAFAISVFQGAPLWSDRGFVEFLPILGLTLGPTLIGHNLINRAMRSIPSQLVSVGQLSQVLWAGILAWIIYNEVPRIVFYPSVLLISLGMGIIVYAHYKHQNKKHNKEQENYHANSPSRS